MIKFYLLSLLSTISFNSVCQTVWNKYSDNPVMVPTEEWEDQFTCPCSVIYSDSIYHMWYWAGTHYQTESIGYATSSDGINWTKYEGNPVLEVGPAGAWDDNFLHGCTVTLVDSIYHMWYTGHTGETIQRNYRIGHATSLDGMNWTKDPNNPVMDMGESGAWDEDGVLATGTVIHDGTTFHMWFEGNGTDPSGWTKIGYATSPDGVNWTKDSLNPVLSPDYDWEGNHAPTPKVVFDGDNYKMWYSAGSEFEWQIGYATSEDGKIWEKYERNPVLSNGPAGSWEQAFLLCGPVLDSAGVKYKMWYFGESGISAAGAGYAESDTRVPYVLVVENKPLYDFSDTVIAEIVLDGTIYIIPEGTSTVVDSIIKYSIASVDVLANTETEIPLTDLSVGRYLILGITNMGYVSTNPYLLKVVDNARLPELKLEDNTVNQGDTINATSNKDGTVYLVNENTPADIKWIRMPIYLQDSLMAQANFPVKFTTDDLDQKDYWLYAVDNYGFISEPETVTIEYGVVVQDNTMAWIRVYPNPSNTSIIIETSISDYYNIEITSLNGQFLFNGEMEGTTHQIDLSSFQKGAYFITIRSKDLVITRKIIKL